MKYCTVYKYTCTGMRSLDTEIQPKPILFSILFSIKSIFLSHMFEYLHVIISLALTLVLSV